MTTVEIETQLLQRGCSLAEDAGDFALVYPFGFENRKRSHDLQAKTRDAALAEAWDWLVPEQRVIHRIEIIRRFVAAEWAISVQTLCGGSRAEPVATARRVAMALAATITPASTYLVGTEFGDRDHGTVLYAKTSVAAQCETSGEFAVRVGMLRAQCLAEFGKGRS
jgi:chromosomal replication initiation ATPase DnaA